MSFQAAAGALIGGFRLEARIGSGGMGEVWRARSAKSDRFVRAIKLIRPELVSDPQFYQRFMLEAESLELLQHPNILRVENIAEDHGVLFMVMEHLQGMSLDAWLDAHRDRHEQTNVAEVCGLMAQVLTGVSHAHANRVIHRDLKPANFFLTASGVVKVLDFGIARNQSRDDTRLTVLNQAMPGSPGYYAPEYSEGADASPASDVYALGICLFELLTGRRPFLPGGGTPEQSLLSVLVQHSTKPMPDVRTLRADVPEALALIILRCGSKNPAMRPSAEALLAAIAEVAQPPLSRREREMSDEDEPLVIPGRRSPWLAVGIVIALVSALIWFALPNDEVVAQPPPATVAAVPEGFAVFHGETVSIGEGSGFDGPPHQVTVAPFILAKREVSIGEARAFVEAHPSVSWELPPSTVDKKPVSTSSPALASQFCAWKVPGGRLPTEEEWELAASRGPAPSSECVHQNQGTDGVSVNVDALPCSATKDGIEQLLGNVAEWTGSHPSLYPGSTAPFPPRFASPEMFVIRGGSFDADSMAVRVTARGVRRAGDAEHTYDVGFRCAAPWQEAVDE